MKFPDFPPEIKKWFPLRPPYPPVPSLLLEKMVKSPKEKSSPMTGQTLIDFVINTELKTELEAKKEEWRAKGYPPGLISMAEAYAIEWPSRMLKSPLFTPIRATPAEEAVARHLLRMGLEIADRWVERMAR